MSAGDSPAQLHTNLVDGALGGDRCKGKPERLVTGRTVRGHLGQGKPANPLVQAIVQGMPVPNCHRVLLGEKVVGPLGVKTVVDKGTIAKVVGSTTTALTTPFGSCSRRSASMK